MLKSDSDRRFEVYIAAIGDYLAEILKCSPQEARAKVSLYEKAIRMIGMYDSPRDMAGTVAEFLRNGWTPEQWQSHIQKLQGARPSQSATLPNNDIGTDIVLGSTNGVIYPVSVRNRPRLRQFNGKTSKRYSVLSSTAAGSGRRRDSKIGKMLAGSERGSVGDPNAVVVRVYPGENGNVLIAKGLDVDTVKSVRRAIVRHNI